MRLHRSITTLSLAFIVLAGGAYVSTSPVGGQASVATAPAKLADGIVLAKPESVGFSSEALKDLDTGTPARRMNARGNVVIKR